MKWQIIEECAKETTLYLINERSMRIWFNIWLVIEDGQLPQLRNTMVQYMSTVYEWTCADWRRVWNENKSVQYEESDPLSVCKFASKNKNNNLITSKAIIKIKTLRSFIMISPIYKFHILLRKICLCCLISWVKYVLSARHSSGKTSLACYKIKWNAWVPKATKENPATDRLMRNSSG
jgi:hypothetical protein